MLTTVTGYGQSWKWIAYGDTRNNPPRTEHKEVLQSMIANTPDFKFIINVGDVVDHGAVTSEWEGFYKESVEVLGTWGQDQVPPRYMAAPGNHDATETSQGLTNWHTYLPGQLNLYGNEGKFFVFDYENARFVVMDTIKNNPKTWLFAFWHHPIFDFGDKSYEDEIHDTWGIPLYQYGCDIIFNGHAHYYVRSKKLALNGEMNPPLDSLRGTVQIVTGNGGAPGDVPIPSHDGNEYLVEAYNTTSSQYGYTELTVDADTMSMRHILRDGTVYDEAVYIANPKNPVNKLEQSEYTLPTENRLYQNYPNPFNPSTIINYELRITTEVELSIYNLLGQKVVRLVSERQQPGYHQVQWDASQMTSGVYYYRIKACEFNDVKKMILLQ
jgi:hypothetical protein